MEDVDDESDADPTPLIDLMLPKLPPLKTPVKTKADYLITGKDLYEGKNLANSQDSFIENIRNCMNEATN